MFTSRFVSLKLYSALGSGLGFHRRGAWEAENGPLSKWTGFHVTRTRARGGGAARFMSGTVSLRWGGLEDADYSLALKHVCVCSLHA